MSGKPHVMTTEMLSELKEAFLMGFNDKEACLYCDLAISTFYDYCSKNPDFRELTDLLKESPKLQAKKNIVANLNSGDVDTAKWYLERRSKDEFSLRQEIQAEVEGGQTFKVEYVDAPHANYDENGNKIPSDTE